MRWDIKLKNNHIIIAAAFLLIVASLWRLNILDINTKPRVIFLAFFELSVMVLFAVVLWGKASKWWALFLLLTVISTACPLLSARSYGINKLILLGCLWFFFLVNYLKEDSIKYLLDAICIIALCNVVFLVVQYMNINPLYLPKKEGQKVIVGLMANPNQVSALLAFCFPAFLRGRWKWLIPAVLLGLILAKSFAGPLAVGIGMIVYIAAKQTLVRSLIVVIIALMLFAGLVDKPSIPARVGTLKWGLEATGKRWVMGYGLGHWAPIRRAVEKAEGRAKGFMAQAHNEYIQMFFEMGIGFLLIVAGYFISIIRRFKEQAIIPIVAVVIIAVNSMAFFPFHIATTAMIAITWMAILEIQLNECQV